MEITNVTQPSQLELATHPCKYYSEQELLHCLKNESLTVKAFLSLIESNFEKDNSITELKQSVTELTKRITYLEKKALQKPGRPRREFWVNGTELDDDYLMYLIDYGYYDNISKLEKDVGAGKNSSATATTKRKRSCD